MSPEKYAVAQTLFTAIGVVGVSGMVGWVVTTWMRIKHGYPLDGAWGQSVYPREEAEATDGLQRLREENAQLRAELGSIKDRLATLERIVTDEGARLAHNIEQLRTPAATVRTKDMAL